MLALATLSNKDLSSSINFKRFSTVEELVKVTISTLCSFNKAFISSLFVSAIFVVYVSATSTTAPN